MPYGGLWIGSIGSAPELREKPAEEHWQIGGNGMDLER